MDYESGGRGFRAVKAIAVCLHSYFVGQKVLYGGVKLALI